ncbi:hypothetical protein FPZ24_08195 [Sphingomonas panacisoli]|uniref:Coat protein n=1 Tax=Sphingomonas panacisoli TaxID=1813879 RepID=A0A5B8LH97_9SPHN|nr:P22 phage major capsid protein family protein [Sphingomonas panacisoli]QDZ07463.1 hypothetical protein FPZ24_08195 [Sphingomonas panacisoli]
MANAFSKNTLVDFNDLVEGFEDNLVISKTFRNLAEDGQALERAFNTVWVPQPYIAQSFTGINQTSNFARTYTQLSVPVTLSYSHSVPFTFGPLELRDPLQQRRVMKAALQRLASDINVDCSNLAALQGSIVSKRTTAASGFDDVAALDTAMNRMGISMADRKALYSSGDYNSMASDLQKASRSFGNKKSDTAYEKAYVGDIAGFETYKLDYGYTLTAATATGVTITNTLPLFYTPVSTTLSTDGLSRTNNDNRFQTVSLGVTGAGVKAGDAFTIAGVFEVNHITKQSTGVLKTFRIISQSSGSAGAAGNYVISPPIIAGTGATDPELQYKNVSNAPTNGAVITFLNTVTTTANPFWQDDAMVIMPAKYEPDPNSGMAVTSLTTDSGITIVMAKQAQIGTLDTLYRLDAYYGLADLQPEMSGIQLFNQT